MQILSFSDDRTPRHTPQCLVQYVDGRFRRCRFVYWYYFTRRLRQWQLKELFLYIDWDIVDFVMYCIYGQSRPSLLIQSTDSIILYTWFCAIFTCVLVLSIYTPGFVLFLLAYWYLVYIRLVFCYSYLPIGTCILYMPGFVLFLLACILVLSIYTPGFVLFLLAYWYLV